MLQQSQIRLWLMRRWVNLCDLKVDSKYHNNNYFFSFKYQSAAFEYFKKPKIRHFARPKIRHFARFTFANQLIKTFREDLLLHMGCTKIFCEVYFLRIRDIQIISKGLFSRIKKTVFQKKSSRGFLQKKCSYKFRKIHRKYLCQSLFFNKVAGLRLWHRCFPENFVKFLRISFLTEHLRAAASEYNYTLTTKHHCLRMPI